ncbi:uncharacterized protein LOC113788667 isoform X2 [Dermatophagoides pteronyssinus]|uniref:uncharacterized protein LOC113788667 isoform X2 n=1 Tax=Dermatophagoides pteronyssinus TaxID=6956 RepID=UPI003F67C30A
MLNNKFLINNNNNNNNKNSECQSRLLLQQQRKKIEKMFALDFRHHLNTGFLHLIVTIAIFDKNVDAFILANNTVNNPHNHNVNDNINNTIIKQNDNQSELYVTCDYETPSFKSMETDINDLFTSTALHFWFNIFPIILATIGMILAFAMLAYFMRNNLPTEYQENLKKLHSKITTTTTTITNNDQTSSSLGSNQPSSSIKIHLSSVTIPSTPSSLED